MVIHNVTFLFCIHDHVLNIELFIPISRVWFDFCSKIWTLPPKICDVLCSGFEIEESWLEHCVYLSTPRLVCCSCGSRCGGGQLVFSWPYSPQGRSFGNIKIFFCLMEM